jgi:uncharacterized protein
MLSLNLAKIRTGRDGVEKVRFEQAYAPEALREERENFTLIAPVDLAFDISRDKDQFHLVGRVQTKLELPCGRCLEPFTLPVDAAFDLRYHPRTENSGEGEREVEEDDLTTAFYENEEIDLGQLMHEQLYLSMPMKPLCRDDCRGLCPQCGTNLNRGTCDCPRAWEDPRLAVLKTLKSDRHKEH